MDESLERIKKDIYREEILINKCYGSNEFVDLFCSKFNYYSHKLSCLVINNYVSIFKKIIINKVIKFNQSRIVFRQARFGELNLPNVIYYFIYRSNTFFFFESSFNKSLREILFSEGRINSNVIITLINSYWQNILNIY